MFKNLSIELIGIAKTMVTSLILSLLATVIVYYTGLAETLFAPLGNLILIISIFMGACHITKKRGSKGLFRGINLGMIIFIMLFIATLLFNSSLINMKTFLYTLCLCIVSGGLGGILGIGLSDSAF